MKRNIKHLIMYIIFIILDFVINWLMGYENVENDIEAALTLTIPLFLYTLLTWRTNIYYDRE